MDSFDISGFSFEGGSSLFLNSELHHDAEAGEVDALKPLFDDVVGRPQTAPSRLLVPARSLCKEKSAMKSRPTEQSLSSE